MEIKYDLASATAAFTDSTLFPSRVWLLNIQICWIFNSKFSIITCEVSVVLDTWTSDKLCLVRLKLENCKSLLLKRVLVNQRTQSRGYLLEYKNYCKSTSNVKELFKIVSFHLLIVEELQVENSIFTIHFPFSVYSSPKIEKENWKAKKKRYSSENKL